MLKEKLLTLTSAAGILACGACFGPGPSYQPPPPPLRPLGGVHTLRVSVVNTSPTHQLDRAILARELAKEINRAGRIGQVRASATQNAGAPDGFLAVEILAESSAPSNAQLAKNHTMLSFRFIVSLTLTGRNGEAIWSAPRSDISFPETFDITPESGPLPRLESRRSQAEISADLSYYLAQRLLFLK